MLVHNNPLLDLQLGVLDIAGVKSGMVRKCAREVAKPGTGINCVMMYVYVAPVHT